MSTRKYVLIITNEAKADIQAIANYTTIRWSADQARKYLGVVYNRIQDIQGNIDIDRSRYGLPEAIKGYKAQKHIIFYRVENESIFVLRILHEKMDHARYM